MHSARKSTLLGLSLILAWLAGLAWRILSAGGFGHPLRADVAIVLGTAVWGRRPSPVFKERIRHAIYLFKSGTVAKLLFTGGFGDGETLAEAEVARDYALAEGVPAEAILLEDRSTTTWENLYEARALLRAHGLKTALLVSDPLHMKRALRMARDLSLTAVASPTPTTRYRSWRTKLPFLLREIYFYHHYFLFGR